jgi:adenylate cyclase
MEQPVHQTILVVDDDQIIRRIVTGTLEKKGYTVLKAADGAEALKVIEKNRVDLIVSDLMMPVMDGLELLRHVRENPRLRSVMMILLTARSTDEERLAGLQQGADDYVQKPFNVSELLIRVERLLAYQSRHQEMANLFSMYVSRDVADQIIREAETKGINLEGEEREVAILFADIRGFTSYTERHPPKKVLSDLNHLLAAMTGAIFDNQGVLDKYLGDGVMAIFGAPLDLANPTENAFQCALAIQRAIDTEPALAGMRSLGVGIGIAYGTAIIGSIGTRQRLQYTAIGDTVNVASRLCDMALAGEIVLTEVAHSMLEEGHARAEAAVVSLSGKAAPVSVCTIRQWGASPQRIC